MLNQNLQQKLLQKLSPQQIQLIKLLEVPTMQLEQRIKKEMEENPALEEGSEDVYETDNFTEDAEAAAEEEHEKAMSDEFSFEDYIEDDETPSYRLNTNNYSKDDKKLEVPFSVGSTFHESLHNQLSLRILSEREKSLAEYVIGNIDEDGYLRREIESIVDDLAFSQNISTEEKELENILLIIQDFDPAGVGARDLRECLVLQLERKMKQNATNSAIKLARNILNEHFEEFTKKHYDKIIARMNISSDDLKDAVNEVLRLNPRPGGSYLEDYSKSFEHIVPDFILEVVDNEFNLSLNSKNAPDLRISRTYSEMLESFASDKKKHTRSDKEAVAFVKQKLDSAKWFIDAIKQRQNTLMLSMQAIINYQQEYFRDGDETKMRPMILKDIAEKTNLDISTISRVANSKYIQTHFGIFPLKFFFSESMQTENGEEVSTREIKKILQECIESEEKKKPLTDERLARILQTKGYQIARRTVAKYREQMNIMVARLRKEL